MSDENVDDYVIVPAAKIINVLFRNCNGRMSHWVEPYLRLTVSWLHRTEKPYLEHLLVEVVRNKFHVLFHLF